MTSKRKWQGKWIGAVGCPDKAAPLFKRSFTLEKRPEAACVRISGMGFYVLYLNGKRVGDHILAPGFTAYDKTVLYDTYEVAAYLQLGENRVEVLLGDGWYRESVPNAWEFEHAAWRSWPQLIFELEAEGKILLCSDHSWAYAMSCVTYNSLRCGETYDATKEITSWTPAQLTHGPGGVLTEKEYPPVRLCEELSPVRATGTDADRVYDFGVNLSGNVEITVSGPRGARLSLQYTELLDEAGQPELGNINCLVQDSRFQRDEYILSGEGEETWHSEFGYHGFRYVRVWGDARLVSIKARCFHTDLASAGGIDCDYQPVMELQAAVRRSTLTNFHHIPTDCPHREKNGWTGDAHLSSEQALFNFDMKAAYQKWLDDVVDSQRPNGAISCIVPTSVWGYNWGSGATWDNVLFEIPWQVYRYTGDKQFLARYYGAMGKYLDFLEGMGQDGIFRDGLGDWCPPKDVKTCPDEVLVTAYAYHMFDLYGKISAVLGKSRAAQRAQKRAAEIKRSFQKAYVGTVAGSQTFYALLLYFGFIDEPQKTLQALLQEIEAADGHLQCGIFGAKFLFQALTDAGHFDEAWKVAMAEGYPGYRDMLRRCSGTLGEQWEGTASQNHHMYSDIGGWLYKALAGIQLDDARPGFAHIFLQPHIPQEIQHFSAWHQTPLGRLTVSWDEEELRYSLPAGCSATLQTPEGSMEVTGEGCLPRGLFAEKPL